VPLRTAKDTYRKTHVKMAEERAQKNPGATGKGTATAGGKSFEVADGAVLIAAITSCTNTSNPPCSWPPGCWRAMPQAGLTAKPWVKTSLAPGSRVVTDYLKAANLLGDLESVGFYLVGYGCTTCIGNSGPLRPEISDAVKAAT